MHFNINNTNVQLHRRNFSSIRTNILLVTPIWSVSKVRFNFQKQPPRGALRKRFSENMQQIYRRTPMPKCNFSNFIEIALRHECSAMNLLHIFRTPFLGTPLVGCFSNLEVNANCFLK